MPRPTSAARFLTVQESLVSGGCCPVSAHLQCPGKPRFQCSLSRYLRGDRDCSLISLQKLSYSKGSEWKSGGECRGAVWCGGPGRTFGVVEVDGSEVAEPHFLIKLIKHGFHSPLRSQVVSYQPASITRYGGDWQTAPLRSQCPAQKESILFGR